MHPVQAAPRQRHSAMRRPMKPLDAPRAGSAEAKAFALWAVLFHKDAPRAGSAEAKLKALGIDEDKIEMHPVQAAPRQS